MASTGPAWGDAVESAAAETVAAAAEQLQESKADVVEINGASHVLVQKPWEEVLQGPMCVKRGGGPAGGLQGIAA